VERVTRAMLENAAATARYDLNGAVWDFTAGKQLTYSFVPDNVYIDPGFPGDPGGPNVINARMNELFGGNTALWKSLFAQSFARWSSITGIVYTEVTDDGASWGSGTGNPPRRGQIRIAARNIDGAGNILAFNAFPSSTGGGGDMVLDSSESSWANENNNYRRIRNVVMHEHGHGLGLNHVCPINISKLMEPFLAISFDGPQHDDIRGGQAMYGDRYEPNNNTGQATFLGFQPFGASLFIDEVGIRDIGDPDVFSMAVPQNARLSVVVTPDGFPYNQEPQDFNGACGPGEAFNSANLANLQISILGSTGQVLASANTTGFGGTEQILNYALPAGGGLVHVRVAPFTMSSGTARSQLYSLAISLRSALTPCPGDLTGDGLVNSDDLAQLLSLWTGPGPAGDLDGSGRVDAQDLSVMLGQWGACPP